MKKALITGVTGQDGSYLAELLLEKGYEVHGVVRRHSTPCTERIDHLLFDEGCKDRFFLHYGDLTDAVNLAQLVRTVEPDEVYNLAAQSQECRCCFRRFSLMKYTTSQRSRMWRCPLRCRNIRRTRQGWGR